MRSPDEVVHPAVRGVNGRWADMDVAMEEDGEEDMGVVG